MSHGDDGVDDEAPTISTTLDGGAGAVDRYDVEVLVSFSFSFYFAAANARFVLFGTRFSHFFRLSFPRFEIFFFFGLACRRDGCATTIRFFSSACV